MKTQRKCKAIARHILINIINIFPVSRKMIIFEAVDFGDNSKALFDRMRERGIADKYRIIWVVRDAEEHRQLYPDIKFLSYGSNTVVYWLYRTFAGYCFSSHCLVGIKRRRRQVRCFLTHGLSFKETSQFYRGTDAYTDIITTSRFAAELRKRTFHGADQSMRILGYPRTDLLFRITNAKKRMGIPEHLKLIVWMPTFKHYVNGSRNDGGESKNDLLSFFDKKETERLNRHLQERNIFLMIKFHPNQDLKFVKMVAHSNIGTYINYDLREKGVDIYEILASSDGLITDFSSVYTDYLLCDKPIGFDISGMENYQLGFSVDNPIDYMPGMKIKGMKELLDFMDSVVSGQDTFSSERQRLKNKIHQYTDGRSSDRIIDYFGL